MDWTIQTGGTPSSSTGPSGAFNGTYYIYMESSSPNYPSKVANLVSPCIDLTSAQNAELRFHYNMCGAAMGALNVQLSTNGTDWTTKWTKSGDQGTSWQEAIDRKSVV